jgi:hypothetical protein
LSFKKSRELFDTMPQNKLKALQNTFLDESAAKNSQLEEPAISIRSKSYTTKSDLHKKVPSSTRNSRNGEALADIAIPIGAALDRRMISGAY